MNTKLTLRMDETLIRRAKAIARRSGKSVSQLVADYFRLLDPRTTDKKSAGLTPTVRALRGVLRGRAVGQVDYRRHLEKKYR